MMINTIVLTDAHSNRLATMDVDDRSGYNSGSIHLDEMPNALLQAFEQYEEIVNNQMFGLLDQAEAKIFRYDLKIVFDDGREALIDELQVFPGNRRVSFRVTAPTRGPAIRGAQPMV
jgi:hypothetical protein